MFVNLHTRRAWFKHHARLHANVDGSLMGKPSFSAEQTASRMQCYRSHWCYEPLCLSLACCWQVVSGCGHLSDSQACLKQAGLPRLAPELSKEIDDALHDLQAPALLEQLKVRGQGAYEDEKSSLLLICFNQ